MLKRMLAALCCAALAVSLPLGALAADTYRLAGFDGDDSNHVWSDNDFFTRMQARTGIAFEFDEYTDYDKWETAKQAMFSSGNLPDVLFKAELSTREQIEYAQNGMLIDLKPVLAEYAPNLWALLEANPDWLASITLPDGKIVAPAVAHGTAHAERHVDQPHVAGRARPFRARKLGRAGGRADRVQDRRPQPERQNG